jgi:uncharacterized membrane protein YfcA
MMNFMFYILTGIFAGFLAGLLGIGGGVIIIPSLIHIFPHTNIPPELIMHMAASTSLTTVIFSSAVAVISQNRHQNIDWQLFRKIAAGIVAGTIVGVIIAGLLPDHFLTIIFAFFLFFTSIRLLTSQKNTPNPNSQAGKMTQWLTGGIIGFMSGILGVGGGIISVPLFLRLGLNPHRAAGTSSACVLLLATVAAITFTLTGSHHTAQLPAGSTGYIYWPAVICIATASMFFVPLGTKLARKLSGNALKRVFAIFLLLVAIEMLVKGLLI